MYVAIPVTISRCLEAPARPARLTEARPTYCPNQPVKRKHTSCVCVPRFPASAVPLTNPAARSRASMFPRFCLSVPRRFHLSQPQFGTHVRAPTSPSPREVSPLQKPWNDLDADRNKRVRVRDCFRAKRWNDISGQLQLPCKHLAPFGKRKNVVFYGDGTLSDSCFISAPKISAAQNCDDICLAFTPGNRCDRI